MYAPANSTNFKALVGLADNNGDPITGVAFNDPLLVVQVLPHDAAAWQTVTLIAGTVGTYSANSWVEVGEGVYQLAISNAYLTAGQSTGIRVKYSTNQPQTDVINCTFPAINSLGATTVGTNGDKTNYTLSSIGLLGVQSAAANAINNEGVAKELSAEQNKSDVLEAIDEIEAGINITPGFFTADDRNTDDMVIDCYVQETIRISQYVFDRAKNPVSLTDKNLVFVIETKEKVAVATVTDIDVVGDDNNGFELNLPTAATTEERVLRCSLRDLNDDKRVWGDGFLNVIYSPRVAS